MKFYISNLLVTSNHHVLFQLHLVPVAASCISDRGLHTCPGVHYKLTYPCNKRNTHARARVVLFTHQPQTCHIPLRSHFRNYLLSAIAVNTQMDNFSDLYLPLAFPPYFLSPGTMTSLPDCELHLSIHARLNARNDTHLSSTILYYIISNRCRLRFWMFYDMVYYFYVLHMYIFILLFSIFSIEI